jgi:hypothetical protein
MRPATAAARNEIAKAMGRSEGGRRRLAIVVGGRPKAGHARSTNTSIDRSKMLDHATVMLDLVGDN